MPSTARQKSAPRKRSNGIAARVMDVTGRVVKMQTGFVYHYAFVMMIGVAIIITYFMYTSGGFGQ